jgi:pimeloyl-ACP methyl ester carboxylesterase
MSTLEINGAFLEALDEGDGEPLVLVHGSASDHRTWRAQRSAFADRFRVLTYSRRYHWPNEPIPEGVDYSMPEQVQDLVAVLEAVAAAPAHLVGHSYGAFLSLLAAIARPDLVRSLVLAEPPVLTLYVSNRPRHVEIVRLLLARPRTAVAILRFGVKGVAPATRAMRRGDTERGIRIFAEAVFGPGGYDRLSSCHASQVRDNATNIQAELLGPGFAPLDAEDVRHVDKPTLLVTGECTIPLFRYLTAGLGELLPDSEHAVIPAARHLMHEDDPDAYNATVLHFLAAAPAAADLDGPS